MTEAKRAVVTGASSGIGAAVTGRLVAGGWTVTGLSRRKPSIDDDRGWYDSPAYQEILHLRTDHIEGTTLLVEGVPADYDVRHTAETFRRSLASAG